MVNNYLTLSYIDVQILHTLLNNKREHVHEWQIEALPIPVSLNSVKHGRKTFGNTFAKKTVDMDLATESQELTQLTYNGNSTAIIGQLRQGTLGGCIAWKSMCRALSTYEQPHSNSALIVLFTTLKWTCYY